MLYLVYCEINKCGYAQGKWKSVKNTIGWTSDRDEATPYDINTAHSKIGYLASQHDSCSCSFIIQEI